MLHNLYMSYFKILSMKKYVFVLAVFMLIALASAVYSVEFDDKVIQGLNVTTDVDGAFNTSQSANKTVAVIFEKDDCVYCDMLRDDVLSDSDVQKQLNENFVVVLADIYKYPDIADKYDVYGTPTVQFIDPTGHEIVKIEGYVDSDEFLQILKEI